MKSILALSGIALVLSAHGALADPGRPLEPHEQARQLILSVTQHPAAIPTTTTPATLALADPHELARERILASHTTGAAFQPCDASDATR
ncbi:hypothetical protein [Aromatoleum toluvorans]|nr:hypothetical protein [Aromatoleum toluvorans]